MVLGISRPDVLFNMCNARTKFLNATKADSIIVSKVIKFFRSAKKLIKVSKCDKGNHL